MAFLSPFALLRLRVRLRWTKTPATDRYRPSIQIAIVCLNIHNIIQPGAFDVSDDTAFSLPRGRKQQAVNTSIPSERPEHTNVPACAPTSSADGLAGIESVPAAGSGSSPAMAIDAAAAPEFVPEVDAPVRPAAGRRRRRWVRRPIRINVRVHTLDSLRHVDFSLLWLSMLGATSGLWVRQLMIGWLAYDLTQSAFVTSLTMGLQVAPFLIGGPLGGIMADRWNRRNSLVGTLGYQAVVTAGFGILVVLGLAETWHLMAFALLIGLGWAMSEPLYVALIPHLVPRHELMNAFALYELAFSATRFVVPAATGFLVLWLGPGPTLLLSGAAYVLGGVAVALMKDEQGTRDKTLLRKEKTPFVEGLRYVKSEPLVLGIVILGLLPPLMLVPFVSGLMPVYASEVFGFDVDGLGILMAAMGIGGTLGVVLVATVGDIRYKGRALIGALALSATAAFLFSRSGSPVLALPLLVLTFAGLPSSFAISAAAIQSVVPDNLRGRVFSVSAMLFGVFPVGSLIAGGLAERFGAQTATAMAACAFAVLLALVSLKFRELWSFR